MSLTYHGTLAWQYWTASVGQRIHAFILFLEIFQEEIFSWNLFILLLEYYWIYICTWYHEGGTKQPFDRIWHDMNEIPSHTGWTTFLPNWILELLYLNWFATPPITFNLLSPKLIPCYYCWAAKLPAWRIPRSWIFWIVIFRAKGTLCIEHFDVWCCW